ncbi:sterol desaturase/sphingolipid hydroxylase (fatty acid hydroxylase superfamily) [Neorhizobium galegae]|uniref:sterol desaturase family protein n=1 Tax=Neorhizobium galegae TaxID=399 RepID=UPI001AE23A49|nr:sterol desaturase family protein [Neorhizobium galegae]MBP2562414.1 sterol desaturase/sphingolipid hydroxylase (fatty acid hydroxylase superfamily) [Neorhizobium galegae]
MFQSSVDPSLRAGILIIAASFMLLEYLIGRLARHDTHDLKESAASFGVAVIHGLVRPLEAALVAVPFMLAYRHRLFDIDITTAAGLLALFVAVDFVYYWHHRASHHIRWLWATHAVHHSPTRLNLTAAIRLGWTGNISGHFLFFVPLAWAGFHPLGIVAMLGLNLAYQFFIHTELSPRLGPLEWVLNTPAHHRVHHASNAGCLDKNFGGILIVFDRLFGTFAEAPKTEPFRYGLRGRPASLNPGRIALGEWAILWRDFRRATGPTAKLRVLFGPVGPAPRPIERPANDSLPTDNNSTTRTEELSP